MAKQTEKKEKKLTLWQKLIEIRKVIPYLQKDAQGFNYKYVKGSVLLGLLRPKMDELGILLSYSVTDMETENVERRVFDKKTKAYRTIQTGRVKMRFLFKFLDTENPSDFTSEEMWIQGVGDDIQDIGGYNTYALRYFLLSYFNIPTDDADPDEFENAKNSMAPPELLTDEQVDNIKKAINGHADIKINILKAYSKLELIKKDEYEYVLSVIDKRVKDKEKKNENN